jgi:hypothetical protein
VHEEKGAIARESPLFRDAVGEMFSDRTISNKEPGQMSTNKEQGVNEVYGDGMGGSENGKEQTDYARAALRNQNRFEPDREPRGHNMGDTDKVRG